MKLIEVITRNRAALAMLLALAAGFAEAARPGSGELDLIDRDGRQHSMASLDTRVDFVVNGLVAEVAVRQRFTNRSSMWLEGQYLLPLPQGAAVHALTVRIGERVIVGEIKEKAIAQQIFADASASGRKAALVEADGANLFRAAVTNVAPGESIDVELGYWQRIDYADGAFSLRFPLTYTPRYHAQIGATPVANDPGTQGPEAFASASAEAPLTTEIHVALDAGVDLASVQSPSHGIVSSRHGREWTIALRDARVTPDRDFVLQWKPQPFTQPNVVGFRQSAGDHDYVMLMMMPPQQQALRLPRELILVIDTSGSMSGTPIVQARAAINAALARLKSGDRFNVIEFNSTTRAWQDQAVAASPDNIAAARRWVDALEANGGTEMMPALQIALAGRAPPGFVRQVVFATDGAVDNPAGLMNLIERDLGGSRLFPIGIGSAPNAAFLSAAASRGRGSQTVIADLGEVESALDKLMTRLDHPAMRDLAIDWPAGSEAWPRELPDLYLGEPLMAIARVPAGLAKVQVRGALADRAWTAPAALGDARQARGLEKVFAQAKIADLEDRIRRGADAGSLRPEIVRLALDASLVSRFTSLVATERMPSRAAGDALARTQIPNILPAGASFAQTATPARLQLLLALLALLGAGFAWRLARSAA